MVESPNTLYYLSLLDLHAVFLRIRIEEPIKMKFSSTTTDTLADHYRLQMLAYALALFQHDPTRQVRASLRFTDVGVENRFDWQRGALICIESELRLMLDLVS